MTDKENKNKSFEGRGKGVLYMPAQAYKEAENLYETTQPQIEKEFLNIIGYWTGSLSFPIRNKKRVKKITEDIWELRKTGSQIRLLGFFEENNFYVLKCLKKKRDKISANDIETAKRRKTEFMQNKENLKWEKT